MAGQAMETGGYQHCPVCGRILQEGEACPCGAKDSSASVIDLKTCFKEFGDYLDDAVAPVLVQSSLSVVLNTSPNAPASPDDVADYIFNWANRKVSHQGGEVLTYILFALGAIVKADQYGILDSFDGALFYPCFILKIVEVIPSENVKLFKEAVRAHQEQVWNTLSKRGDFLVTKEFVLPTKPFPSSVEAKDNFIEHLNAALTGVADGDIRLENGDAAYRTHFDELAKLITGIKGFDEVAKRLAELKRAALRFFNHHQIMAAWLLARLVDDELRSRNNELMYRIVYEAGSFKDLSQEILREYLGNAVYYPLLAPLCRLFSELSPIELLLLLMNESDQSTRRTYYNLLKVYDKDILPLLLQELDNPGRHPWYYLRNVTSIIGEISGLDDAQRKTTIRALSRYVSLDQRRQLVISCIHSIARLAGGEAESLLINLLYQKQTGHEKGAEEGEFLTAAEFAFKLIEGLCMINTERAAGEVLEIALGKKIQVTNLADTIQFFALEQLSRLDLNLFPVLRNRVISQIMNTIVTSHFTFRKALLGRDVRFETALLRTLRNTKGQDATVVLKKVGEEAAAVEVREAAVQLLEEQSRETEGYIPIVSEESAKEGGFVSKEPTKQP